MGAQDKPMSFFIMWAFFQIRSESGIVRGNTGHCAVCEKCSPHGVQNKFGRDNLAHEVMNIVNGFESAIDWTHVL
eukprot:354200-Amphidinium_carterae.5